MARASEPASISCPFCGEFMEAQLKFCVACGRAITAEDLKRSGLKIQAAKGKAEGHLQDLARRDYTFHRKSRSLMYTISGVLTILIGYYAAMKYVLHEHMPGNLDVRIEQLMAGIDEHRKVLTPTDTEKATSR